MREGKITRWLKGEGEPVKKGEELFEVETEKVTNAVESPASGVLFQIVVPAGATVPVTTVVAVLAEPGEQPERMEVFETPEELAAPVASAGTSIQDQPERPRKKEFVVATPAARRKAKELGIDLALVPGSGPEGRVRENDIVKFHEEGPRPPKTTPVAAEMARQAGLDLSTISGTGESGKITKDDVQRALAVKTAEKDAEPTQSIPLAGMRKTIAENMYASLKNTAQLTIFTEVDVTETVRFRDLLLEERKAGDEVKVSYTDIIIVATSRALKQFPIMNSTLLGEEIVLHSGVNMGIAVAVADGLIVPVLREADKKRLFEITRDSRELIRKAREGSLGVNEVTGGTFTITTLGIFGIDGFTPILRPPETGILGVGRIQEKPAVYQGQIAIRSMMYLSLTFDHRVVDGAPASEFLQRLSTYVQYPALLLKEEGQ
jgi:pyruvate dehydrogenase E2 component (dihydrolipoamide acetyltransferase)